MKKYNNFTKTNSSYKCGCYHVGRTDMWGNYCPETGEYYLACNDLDPIAGECKGVLATCRLDADDYYDEAAENGYNYEVVRELLQLGHLTEKTLASFVEEGGEVWWDQPNYSYVGFCAEG